MKVRELIEVLRGEDQDAEVHLACDGCDMLMIQGVPCHEAGCPNSSSRWDSEEERWVRTRECRECGCVVDADDPCCDAEEPWSEDECPNCEGGGCTSCLPD